LFHDNFINACFLYRREVRDVIGEYKENLRGYEDFDYWLRVSDVFNIAHIDTDEVLYQYRLHDESMTSAINKSSLESDVQTLIKTSGKRKELIRGKQTFVIESTGAYDPIIFSPIADSLSSSGCRFSFKESSKNSSDNEQIGSITTSQTNSKLDIYCVQADYLHTTHNSACSPYLSAALFITKSDSKNNIYGKMLLPPLTLPPILRRARDTDFGAITKHKGSKGAVLAFMPDEVRNYEDYSWSTQTLKECIKQTQSITFALLCRNKSQLHSATSLHKALIDSPQGDLNLRIIDISDEEISKHNNSLLYVLSSADAIISIKSPIPTVQSLLETRTEAALGALAGIGVIGIFQEGIHNLENQRLAKFYEELLFPPNMSVLFLNEYSDSKNVDISRIFLVLCRDAQAFEYNSLEQWTQQQQGLDKIALYIKTLLFNS
jgi:hypothetical protein